jgi:hypothetical protein
MMSGANRLIRSASLTHPGSSLKRQMEWYRDVGHEIIGADFNSLFPQTKSGH